MHFPIVPRYSSATDVLLSSTVLPAILRAEARHFVGIGEGGLEKEPVIQRSELIRFHEKAIRARDQHISLQGMGLGE